MSWNTAPARPTPADVLKAFDPDLPGLRLIIGRSGHVADAVIAARVGRWWAGRLLTVMDRLEGRVTVAELRASVQGWLASTPEP